MVRTKSNTSMNEARLVDVGAGISDSPPSLRSCCDPDKLSVLGALKSVLLPANDSLELQKIQYQHLFSRYNLSSDNIYNIF